MFPKFSVFALFASLAFSITVYSQSSRGLRACLRANNVPFSAPGFSNFSQLARPYNLRLQYVPAAIVSAKTTSDVQYATICANQFGVKVQAKGGGHSYGSYSSGGKNGSMIIDLEAFNQMSIDLNCSQVTVEGGVRLGNLALFLYEQGRLALPHGVCPGVGIGGHATHGGYWYSSRAWGLTLDRIIGMDIVLPVGNGAILDQNNDPDIFWAMRGAADSFGIVLNFTMQAVPAPATVVNWNYKIPNVLASAKVAAAAVFHIQNFALNASVIDSNIGFGISLSGSNLTISGTYFGSEATFVNEIAPELLRGLAPPYYQQVTTLDWISSLTELWGGPLEEPLSGYDAHDYFYAKSVLVPEDSPLTMEALINYFSYIIAFSPSFRHLWFTEINLFGGPGSAINNPPASALNASYSGRGALWVVQHYASGPPSAEIISFMDNLNDVLEAKMPNTTFGAYANYEDPELSAADAHRLYFEEEKYARLVALKKQLDPNDTFWNPQSVGN